jgi:hypothetical protein
MSDDPAKCSRIIDCAGLHELAQIASDNRKAYVLAELQAGTIGVAACAWNEFADCYEGEAADLAPYITVKIRNTRAYNVGAASLAQKLNSGFPPGPYDANTDLFTASIASKEGFEILTGPTQLKRYKTMKCAAVDVDAWLDQELGC